MSDLTDEIVLRPRFVLSLDTELERLKHVFDNCSKDPFQIKRLDEHIYIRFQKKNTTFWSPQLHLELTSFEKGVSKIHGVFGPNPTLWTFFMFLHFGVGTLFVILSVFAYSNHALGKDITLLIAGMIALVVIWFVLYAFGRMGKSKGQPQMNQLKAFLKELISDFQKL